MRYTLEVGARTVDDVLTAERGGADRVELYSSPLEGALTPSAGFIEEAVAAVTTLKLFVMIRPRAGDFLYSDSEFKTMQRDTEKALELGVDGIMCGILKPDGELDVKRMNEIKKLCGDKSLTLHRAFDYTKDYFKTLEQSIDIGCNHILTIGEEDKATFSQEVLSEIIKKAAGRINVMIALSADFNTQKGLEPLIKKFNAPEYHIVNGYRSRLSEMEWKATDNIDSDPLKDTMFNIEYLSEDSVKETRDILDNCKN
jgi:copper homeostasis protein